MNPISLSNLLGTVNESIKASVGSQSYWVKAEVNHVNTHNGITYLKLIEKNPEDKNAIVSRCSGLVWSQNIISNFEAAAKFKFVVDMEYLFCITVDFSSLHGLSLKVLDIDPNFTVGKLAENKAHIIKRLVAENPDHISLGRDNELLTFNKKLALPTVIKNIALIGSSQSKGMNDFTDQLKSNQYRFGFNIDFLPVNVQGEYASSSMRKALVDVFKKGIQNYDVVIIVRGGGDNTDLLPFNQYELCQAIARFPIPVLCGIGHNLDVSIADMVTHTNLKTPTAVADHLIGKNYGFQIAVERLSKDILSLAPVMIENHISEVNRVFSSIHSDVKLKIQSYKDGLGASLISIHSDAKLIVQSYSDGLNASSISILNSCNKVLEKNRSLVDANFQSLAPLYLSKLYSYKTEVDKYHSFIVNQAERCLVKSQNDLAGLLKFVLNGANSMISSSSRDIKNNWHSICHTSKSSINQQQLKLNAVAVLVDSYDPQKVLKRGYSLVLKNDKVISDGEVLASGDEVSIRFWNKNKSAIIK